MKHLVFLVAFALSITIVMTNLLALTFTDSLYKIYFKNSEELHYAMQVVDYLRIGKPLDDEYFSKQAIGHMSDVKNLINLAKAINAVALFVIGSIMLYLVKKRKYKILKRGLILGTIITTLGILVAFICATLDFNSSFIVFHELIFNNNNWLFTADDHLVELFSLEFFIFYTQKLITSILLTILGLLIAVKFIPNNDSKNT